jgi:hypothetical protein
MSAPRVRADGPLLCADRGVVRQGLETP